LYENPLKIMPAWLMFAEFMRFVDAPHAAPLTASAQHGKELFSKVGCVYCHTASFQTAGTPNPTNEPRDRATLGGAARANRESLL
jgi:cytochrome c peroxidase